MPKGRGVAMTTMICDDSDCTHRPRKKQWSHCSWKNHTLKHISRPICVLIRTNLCSKCWFSICYVFVWYSYFVRDHVQNTNCRESRCFAPDLATSNAFVPSGQGFELATLRRWVCFSKLYNPSCLLIISTLFPLSHSLLSSIEEICFHSLYTKITFKTRYK